MEMVLGLILDIIKKIFPIVEEKNGDAVYKIVKHMYIRAQAIVEDGGTFDKILDVMVPVGVAFVICLIAWIVCKIVKKFK